MVVARGEVQAVASVVAPEEAPVVVWEAVPVQAVVLVEAPVVDLEAARGEVVDSAVELVEAEAPEPPAVSEEARAADSAAA